MKKKIIITGATGGIGTSLVKKFHSLGGKVLATGTNEEKLKKLNKEYPDIHTKKFDISKHDDIEEFINEAHIQLDGLDIIVNNAGITKDNLSLRMNKEEWEKVIGINLSSNFYLCKFAIKKMLKNKFGRVVNISSIVGHTGNVGQVNYSASKGGLISLTKSFAAEYAKKNITVNCVSPGFTATEMTRNTWSDRIKKQVSSILLGRIADPEEIAEVIMFLCSEKCTYITGQNIIVDGGFGIRND